MDMLSSSKQLSYPGYVVLSTLPQTLTGVLTRYFTLGQYDLQVVMAQALFPVMALLQKEFPRNCVGKTISKYFHMEKTKPTCNK